jgi:hypothetical protein
VSGLKIATRTAAGQSELPPPMAAKPMSVRLIHKPEQPPSRIYLKDYTFIPDFIYLKLSSTSSSLLQLCNSDDGIVYSLQCYGMKDWNDVKSIQPGKSILIPVTATGRFEITSPSNALMKVRHQSSHSLCLPHCLCLFVCCLSLIPLSLSLSAVCCGSHR